MTNFSIFDPLSYILSGLFFASLILILTINDALRVQEEAVQVIHPHTPHLQEVGRNEQENAHSQFHRFGLSLDDPLHYPLQIGPVKSRK